MNSPRSAQYEPVKRTTHGPPSNDIRKIFFDFHDHLHVAPSTMMSSLLLPLLCLLSCLQYSHAWMFYSKPPTHCSWSQVSTKLSSSAPETSLSSLQEKVPHDLDDDDDDDDKANELRRLQGKLLKQMRQLCQEYEMLQDRDHIMVCVSGGKDSATLLYLILELQRKLPISFDITAVHVNQQQPGYNGTALIQWLQDLDVNYHIVQEDTYSIVLEKTPPQKSYCTVCSRLRRGILYTTAIQLGCNKIFLGHHGDDALETLLLNMMHSGVLKGMPPRYTTHSRETPLAVARPLLTCLEDDIARFATLQDFPILPCNLCSNQANLQRPQIKLLLSTLESMTPNAKHNMIASMSNVRPSHLMDSELREKCGLDPVTGDTVVSSNGEEINNYENEAV